jgi:hypothetical protein
MADPNPFLTFFFKTPRSFGNSPRGRLAGADTVTCKRPEAAAAIVFPISMIQYST